ncbi:hypothetical protein WA026_010642 [Henosepilachna vigintioctopunctata]|uniref:C2H2-type domain-containing protein n=1 Tax=Henosepilachna vigintioctopunctata TaxID=420089 RepID=A0AAW1UW53_9CUCU
MPYQCRICYSKFETNKLVKEHALKNHSRSMRCSLCSLQCRSLKILNEHYNQRHSKLRIIKQLINYSLRNSMSSLNWVKTKKSKISAKEYHVENPLKTEKLFVKENIHISYGNKDVFIEISSDNEESLELSIDDTSNKSLGKNQQSTLTETKLL